MSYSRYFRMARPIARGTGAASSDTETSPASSELYPRAVIATINRG
jgi:hypothetical protein